MANGTAGQILGPGILIVAGIDNASYWFQAGVRGSTGSNSNNGASVQIETVLPQNLGTGTMGFWAGENLPNGAFLQIGYLVENESGLFPTNCTRSGCSSSEYIGEGDAEWFYRRTSFPETIAPSWEHRAGWIRGAERPIQHLLLLLAGKHLVFPVQQQDDRQRGP